VKKLLLCLFVGILTPSNGQIKLRDFSFGIDYNNTSLGVWNYQERRRLGVMGEMNLTDMFSTEVYYYFDGDGYAPYTYTLGAGLNRDWGGGRFDRIYQEGYAGMRMYPLDNFHSQALALRNKEPYGVYVSYGYRVSLYNRNEFGLRTSSQPVLDDNGDYVTNDDGSVLNQNVVDNFDTWGYTLAQWGVNFGVGWKQYHNKFIYTDLGVYSSAFMKRQVTSSWYAVHIGDRIWSEEVYDDFIRTVETYSKNGRGFELRMILGINLDFRK